MWGRLGNVLLNRAFGAMSDGGGESAPAEEAEQAPRQPLRTNRGINLDELISDSFARSAEQKQRRDMLDRQLFSESSDFE